MRAGIVEDLRSHYGLAEQTWRQHQFAVAVDPNLGSSGALGWDGVCLLNQEAADSLQRFGATSPADRARFMAAVRDPNLRADWTSHANAKGLTFDAGEVDGMLVMVHENIHGHGALTANIYQGVGATVEEMTTETMARRYMAERLGTPRGLLYGDLPDAPGCGSIGAYNEIIDPVVAGIGKDLKLGRAEAIQLLEDASLAFKRHEVGATPTVESSLDVFLDGLPAKTRAKTRDRLQRLAAGEAVEVKAAKEPKPKPDKASKAKPAPKPKKAPVDKAAIAAQKAEAAAAKKAAAAEKRRLAAEEKKRVSADAKAAKAAAAKEAKARAAAEKKAAAAKARADAAAAKKAALAAAREAAKAEKARIAAEKKAAAAEAKKAKATKPAKKTPAESEKPAKATKATPAAGKVVKLPAPAPYDYSDEERAEFKQDAMEAIVETRERWWSTKMADGISATVEDGFTVSQKQFFDIRKKFAQDLAYDELDACLYYSHKGDGVLNSGIRYGMIKDEPDVQEMADRLNSAIRRYKMPKDTYVARGLGGEWAQQLGAKLKPGDTFREPGFSSTSATGFAEEFAGEVRMRIKVPKGAHAAPIPTRYAEEYEYLLPSGTEFRVVSKKKAKGEDGDIFEIELEVVT